MMHGKRFKIINISVLFAVIGINVLSGMLWPLRAQSSDWSGDWQRIHSLYYDEVQPAAAIQLLERRLAEKGNLFSDEILDGILAMLKDYFSYVSEPSRFKEIVGHMMRSGKDAQIADYFGDKASLHAYAQEARTEWMKPAKASILVTKKELTVGETTEYKLAVYNKYNEQLGVEGIAIVPSFADRIMLDTAARQITAVSEGDVSLYANSADGVRLGTTIVRVVSPPPTPTSAKVSFESDVLEIGQSTKFEVQIFDQNKKPVTVDYGELRFELNPTNLATLDEAGRLITARREGDLTLRVLSLDGTPLHDANITIIGALVVAISPPSAQIRAGETTLFSIESTRPFIEEGLQWSVGPVDVARGFEKATQQMVKQIEVEGVAPGQASLRVFDRENATLAEANLEVEAKPASAPPAGPTPPAEKKGGLSIVYPIIAGGVAIGLTVAAIAGKNKALGISAGVCGAAALVLGYLSLSGGDSGSQTAAVQPETGGFQLEAGATYLGFNYRF